MSKERSLLIVLMLLLLGATGVPGHAQEVAATAPGSAPTCTDLSGDPVPCPNAAQPFSANRSASTERNESRCTDASGEAVACPGEAQLKTSVETTAPVSSAVLQVSKTEPPTATVSAPPAEPGNAPCTDVSHAAVSCPEPVSTSASVSSVYIAPQHVPSLETSLPRNFYEGQKDFWTMPARLRLADLYWGVPFGLTTAALVASDPSIKKALPQSPGTIKRFDSLSNYGAFAFGGLVGGEYLLGKWSHNSYLSDTAWLAGEAGLNGFVTTYGLKYAIGRQRPDEGNGKGDFFSGGQSFPSEHAAAAWSVAAVFADRYPSNWTKFFLYGGASTISLSRMIAQKHFASDVFVGSAIGWYFGHQALKRYERERGDDSIYGSFVREAPETPSIYGRGSAYIELDSWIYPAVERLAAVGVVNAAFMGVRPWTRAAVYSMVNGVAAERLNPVEAGIVARLRNELRDEADRDDGEVNESASVDQLYTRSQYISGTPLNNSFHFGQTLVDDFGRPYAKGFQQLLGAEGRAQYGPFSVFVRGEYQHTPSIPGYDDSVAQVIANQDTNSRFPVPVRQFNGIPAQDAFRLLDTYASINVAGNDISIGKQSYWWGPGSGSALFLSNNVEPLYSVRIARTTPLYLPGLSRIIGPVQYDNFFGKLYGNLDPSGVWIYGQKITFHPTANLELGFSRNAVIGGDGVAPITFGNFFHSFTSTTSGTCPGCSIRENPGARHANFDFTYRLPWVRNWLKLYADSLVHDHLSPIDAPRRAAVTPGIYLSHFPGISKLDLHVEGGTTDTVTSRALGGQFYYYEQIYHDGYTNKGNLLGSWLGREGTGGTAWTTYWFNAQSTLKLGYRYVKTSQFFVPQGETQHDAYGEFNYAFRSGVGLRIFLQAEHWTAPLLAQTPQTDVTTQVEVFFSPQRWKKSSQKRSNQNSE